METFLFIAILTMLVIAVISFIVLKKRWQFSIKLFLVGLIGFALPVMMIEGPINALVLSSFGHSSKWFTIIYGGLMAGLVEETTRYLVFKVLAKKRSLMTSDIVAYGFGHGLSEFIFLGVMGLLTNIIVLQAIHSGQASELPSTLVSQVNQLTGFAVLMSLFERLVALVLQVLLTAWDFLAVTKHKLHSISGRLYSMLPLIFGRCLSARDSQQSLTNRTYFSYLCVRYWTSDTSDLEKGGNSWAYLKP